MDKTWDYEGAARDKVNQVEGWIEEMQRNEENYFRRRDRDWSEIGKECELKPSFNFHWFNLQKSQNVTCFFSISIGWWEAFKPWLNVEFCDGVVLNIGWFPEPRESDVEAVSDEVV